MQYQTFFKLYESDKSKLPLPKDHSQRIAESLAVQVHSSGARPKYVIGNRNVTPENYDKKFDTLFSDRLLNRHPNEGDELYNWRLSNYNPLSEDIFNRFLIGSTGAILQPNNYVISTDDKTTEYLRNYPIDEKITECLEFILNNPSGYMAVIVEMNKEFDGSQPAKPQIEFIEPCDVIMYDEDSFAFMDDEMIIFIDRSVQVTYNTKTKTPIELSHNFGQLPVWDCGNKFTKSFVKFADELIKNFSDDGMMTKQYSYPTKQVVSPQCPECKGQKVNSVPVKDSSPTTYVKELCRKCNGKGVMTQNPGDHYAISEEHLLKYNGNMPDMVRFVTPDVGIPKYHMERWMEFYTKCERSLRLNPLVNGVQSGDAKKEDRKDQYAFLSAISKFLFENIRKALVYISAYNNYNNANQTYEAQNVIVVAPKQLDLMTDSDLVAELINIQAKTDDSMILGETQYAVTNKIYRDDNVQSKINEILYQIDPLYGATGMQLKNKLLSGVYDLRDKTIHEKGYRTLLQLSVEMTQDVFMQQETRTLIEKFNQKIDEVTPKGIYSAV